MSAVQSKLSRFDELLTEQEVCQRYSALVGPRELRKARQNGDIAFVAGKKGAVFYHPDELATYLQRKEVQCQRVKSCSNTAGTGSVEPTALPSSTPIDMNEEAERLLVDHLAQRFSTKRKPG